MNFPEPMSPARSDLYAWVVHESAAEHVEAIEMLDAYRDAILREAADKIRKAAAGIPEYGGLCPEISTAQNAARLIDPRTPERDRQYRDSLTEGE